MVTTLSDRNPVPPQGVAAAVHNPLPHLVPPQDIVPTPHDPHCVVTTLRELGLLCVPNWYLLGLQLGISKDELAIISRNFPQDDYMCNVKMFGAWLRVDTKATYEKLAMALVTVGKRNIAEDMCTARGTKAKHVHVCYSVYIHNVVELGGGMN